MSGSSQFAAVFRTPQDGGPQWTRIKNQNGDGYPNWPDIRKGGNTDANQDGSQIMSKWDQFKTKRFEIFMEQFYKAKTPWKSKWMQKTAPGFKDDEVKIIKCKMELMKRIFRIKIEGPQSLEDWILLFLINENDLAIPLTIDELIRPTNSRVSAREFLLQDIKQIPVAELYHYPPRANALYPSNMFFKGITDRGNQYDGPDRAAGFVPRIGHISFITDRNNVKERQYLSRVRRYPKSTDDSATYHLQGRPDDMPPVYETVRRAP